MTQKTQDQRQEQPYEANLGRKRETDYAPLRKHAFGIIAGGLMMLHGLSLPYSIVTPAKLSRDISPEDVAKSYVLIVSGAALLGSSIGRRSSKKSELEKGIGV